MPNIKTASNNTITGDTRVMQPVRESKTENKSTLTKSRTKTKTISVSSAKKHWKLICVAAVGVYCAVSFVMQISTLKNIEKEKVSLTNQLEQLQQQQSFLESELDYVGSDEYVERYAREKLGWVYSDEIVYKEADSTSQQDSSSVNSGESTVESSSPSNSGVS